MSTVTFLGRGAFPTHLQPALANRSCHATARAPQIASPTLSAPCASHGHSTRHPNVAIRSQHSLPTRQGPRRCSWPHNLPPSLIHPRVHVSTHLCLRIHPGPRGGEHAAETDGLMRKRSFRAYRGLPYTWSNPNPPHRGQDGLQVSERRPREPRECPTQRVPRTGLGVCVPRRTSGRTQSHCPWGRIRGTRTPTFLLKILTYAAI